MIKHCNKLAGKVLPVLLLTALLSCGGKEKTDTPDDPQEEEQDDGQPADYLISAQAGWDIYTAGTYRYGPSIIINEDGSIDAWFAATGGSYASEAGEQLGNSSNHTPINLSNNSVGLAFTVSKPFFGLQACCPTWGTSGTEHMTMRLFKWDESYGKSIGGTPVLQREVLKMEDNAWNKLVKEDDTPLPAGRYLLVLDEGSSKAGVWFDPQALDVPERDLQAYQNGSPKSGTPEVILLYDSAEGREGSFWDQISYQHSTDGGKTWTAEVMVLKPTYGSRDQLSCCDPGVVKIGDYYYLGYTSTEHTGGLENHLYMARGTSPRGPWEKWNGSGWGGDQVEPIVTYTGGAGKWGVGEPSMVVKDGLLYIYYSWNDTGTTTRLSVAPADDPLWPAKMTSKGTAINKSDLSAADHCDVKYCDAMEKFIAIHTANRMTSGSYIQVWTSTDGFNFYKQYKLTGKLGGGLHNIGISGDAQGHIDIEKQQYIGYAYGLNAEGNSTWGQWNTMWNPLTFTKKKN